MVRLGGRGYLENLSTEFEKDIRNSLLYHGSLPRHVPRQQRRPTPLGRLEDAYCHDLRRERVVAAGRRVEGSVRGLDGVELLARLFLRPGR